MRSCARAGDRMGSACTNPSRSMASGSVVGREERLRQSHDARRDARVTRLQRPQIFSVDILAAVVSRAVLRIEDADDAIDLVLRRPVELADVAVVPEPAAECGLLPRLHEDVRRVAVLVEPRDGAVEPRGIESCPRERLFAPMKAHRPAVPYRQHDRVLRQAIADDECLRCDSAARGTSY